MLKIFYPIFLALAFTACNQKPQAEALANQATPETVKSSCDKPKKLLDDIEKQTCVYYTNSLAIAYQQLVKDVNIRQGKTTKLRRELPLSNVEDSFEKEQLWVTFDWKNKTEVLVTVTSEGEETDFLMQQLKDKVEISRTLALQ